MIIYTQTGPRPGEHPLRIHPLVLTAFDTLAASGCAEASGKIGRAVLGPGTDLLVFSGFGVFFRPADEIRIVLENDLPPDAIQRAAWDDVADALRFFSRPAPARRAFAQTLAQNAPADRLADFLLPPDRNAARLLQHIRAGRTDADRQPSIFQSALRQLRGSRR